MVGTAPAGRAAEMAADGNGKRYRGADQTSSNHRDGFRDLGGIQYFGVEVGNLLGHPVEQA
jgi:hypothetical protein